MSVSLHQVSALVFIRGLTGLKGVLAKAAAHVEAKNLDPNALLQARLYPDMFPLIRQVQIAADFAKGAVGRAAGDDFPIFEDTETSFAELIERVEKTIAYLNSIDASRVDGQEDRDITLVRRGVESVVKAQAYLLEQALPNVFFHLTTAYDILRHNGVEVGKKDFLGTA
jgi:hypothetical protein